MAFPTYDQLPPVYGQPAVRARIRALLRVEAPRRRVLLGICGDSRDTNPSGAGCYFVPNLNHNFFLRYGNTPGSPLLAPAAIGSDATSDPAPWFAYGNSSGAASSGLAASVLPPGVAAVK